MDARPPRSRLWLFRSLALLLPVLLLLGLEGVLRLAGYGYEPALLLREPEGTWRTNPHYALRFFPPGLARAPNALRLAATPAAQTRRVVILGESMAQGVPAPEYGFDRILAARLRRQHPAWRFETINLAMTAINSHVIRDLAPEIAALHPDVVLLVVGNNEVVGPSGPGSFLPGYTPNLGLIRAGHALRRWRVGQALQQLLGGWGQAGGAGEWRGMELFAEHRVATDGPELAAVRAHFAANLEDTVQTLTAAGIPVVLAPTPTRLREFPPFAGAAAQEAYREAVAAEARGDLPAARQAYLLARDRDELRFRADGAIQAVVRQVAARAGVSLVDLPEALGDAPTSPAPIPGGALFFEHVHLRWAGNLAVAQALQPAVERALGLPAPAGAEPAETEWSAALAFSEAAEAMQLRAMLALCRLPPFTAQEGHAAWIAALESEARTLELALTPERRAAIRAALVAAQEAQPDDVPLLLRRLLVARLAGDQAEVDQLMSRYLALSPETDERCLLEAQWARERGDLAAAEQALRRALWWNPYQATAALELARLLFAQERPTEAASVLQAIVARVPGNAGLRAGSAELHWLAGQETAAQEAAAQALRLDPNLAPELAHRAYAAGRVRLQGGDRAGALAAFRAARRHDPQQAAYAYGLAVALLEDPASAATPETLEAAQASVDLSARRNPLALEALARAQAAQGDPAAPATQREAARLFRERGDEARARLLQAPQP